MRIMFQLFLQWHSAKECHNWKLEQKKEADDQHNFDMKTSKDKKQE